MTVFINMNHCCSTGLSIVIRKVDAWKRHDHNAVMQAQKDEREHLEKCNVCGGGLYKGLWPDAKVSEI